MPRTSPAAQRPEDVRAEAEPTPLTGELDLAIRVLVALILGLVLGLEREWRGYPAGLRTVGLVAAGACLFSGLGLIPGLSRNIDPTRIAAQVVTGVGFLGAGSILRQGEEVRGLTTAASVWVSAAIGMAVAFGYFTTAVVSTAAVIVTLVVLRWVENRFFRPKHNRRAGDPKAEPTTP